MPDAAGASAPAFTLSNADDIKPVIEIVAGDLDKIATSAEAAIAASGLPVFQRDKRLVRPLAQDLPAAHGRTVLAAGLVELARPALLDVMAQTADYVRYDARQRKKVRRDPPDKVAEIILGWPGRWTLPPIAGVITTPTLRPDFSVLCDSGYDRETRLFLFEDPAFRMPTLRSHPTRNDGEQALRLLIALLEEFPFLGGDGSVASVDRSVALSAIITPVVRGAMPVAPLHCFRASTAGTGKSYLVDLASVIATGAQCPVISASSDERENEKRLVGLLLGGFPIVSLDNVNGELGGDLLCQAVERPLVRLRPMGKSDIREIETRATLFATGNGLRVRGDMTRRALLCTLDAQTERPEMRTFSFDPLQRVLENRGAYVAAAITVVRSFHTAGRPGLRPPIGSYREWSDVVRSALVWLGQPDPVDSMEAAREDDPELSDLRDLMTAWRGCPSIGADSRPLRDVAEIAERRELLDGGGSGGLLYPDLRNELLRIAGARDGIDTKKLGKWIKARERRLVSITSDDGTTATARFIRDGNAKGGVVKWRLDARA